MSDQNVDTFLAATGEDVYVARHILAECGDDLARAILAHVHDKKLVAAAVQYDEIEMLRVGPPAPLETEAHDCATDDVLQTDDNILVLQHVPFSPFYQREVQFPHHRLLAGTRLEPLLRIPRCWGDEVVPMPQGRSINLVGLLQQGVGVEAAGVYVCEHCARGRGLLWEGCVVPHPRLGRHATAGFNCANCMFNGNQSRCSLRRQFGPQNPLADYDVEKEDDSAGRFRVAKVRLHDEVVGKLENLADDVMARNYLAAFMDERWTLKTLGDFLGGPDFLAMARCPGELKKLYRVFYVVYTTRLELGDD